MTINFISLAVIAFIAALVPIVARAIPGRVIPETVFLLIAGAAFGPYGLQLITLDETITFISDLGLAFLFLLAGFEIEPKKIVGSQGKRGLAVWVLSFGLAALFIQVSGVVELGSIEGIAIAIALTTTALGTLIPILQERNILNSPVGDAVLAYGTWGELGPVIAMAFLLTTRTTVNSIIVLLLLLAICLLVIFFAKAVRRFGKKIFEWIMEGSQTTSQTYVRFTVLLLVLLVAASSLFDLDIVLGAFAAGFVLRYLIPEDNETLEPKLNGMAHGFFIPLFFVVSGAKINASAILVNPVMLVGFIVLLLAIRAVPILISLSLSKETRTMAAGSRMSVALYCTTALPLIVAVTSVAVSAGAMTSDTASVLVAAGAVTVLVMPLLAMLFQRSADFHAVDAAREISEDPKHAGEILRDHAALSSLVVQMAKEEEQGRHLDNLVHTHDELVEKALLKRAAHADWVAKRAAEERDRIIHDYGELVNLKEHTD